jgi:putative membrane-bound dehydrogenase-like protein
MKKLIICAIPVVLSLLCGSDLVAAVPQTDQFPAAFNTDPPDSNPPAPEEMVQLIQLPEGFQATLFAGEPDVQQPICMDFDDRGRMWVAENYTYSGGPYEKKLRDRVIILEDTDGDGKHDLRKVFWDRGFMLTSLTWGFGGLWVLHDGTLSFIPDRNGDDIPDSEPVVMLDGWSKDCGHNFVSGLVWGPDGWLYGRHGIVDTSWPGVPGTPKEERPFMNCGVWRYHPVQHLVEVVCHGTTNPWGLDYNADGQFFMTNNVQGHLWHVIPGARYQRMYGQDFNPFSFELMDMTADHYHWDTSLKWTDSRDGKANDLGGGHSHVGALIYQGDNFPKEYFGKIFMCNTHGRRINVNRLEQAGSGYTGRREPDFMLVKNPWFRGVDIKMGPEGAMYVADWSDNGECHDHDGIHRTSGRIYRIAWGKPELTAAQQQTLKGNNRLAYLNPDWINKPDWFGRHARRIRQELVAAGELSGRSLASMVSHDSALRLLFNEAFGGNSKTELGAALESTDPLVQAEAVRLAASTPQRRQQHLPALLTIAARPQAPTTLLALLSSLQRMDSEHTQDAPQVRLSSAIFSCPENQAAIAADKNLTLMAWYAIEPFVEVLGISPLQNNTKLQQFAVRRIATSTQTRPAAANSVLRIIAEIAASPDTTRRTAAIGLLEAFHTGLAGRAKVSPPADWTTVYTAVQKSDSAELRRAADRLAAVFGDGAAMADLRQLAANSAADYTARDQAILALAQAKDTESIPMLFNLLGDRAVYSTVIKALAGFDHPDTAKELLNRMAGFKDGNRGLAVDTLTSRRAWADQLVAAVEAGRFDAKELTAAQVRQLLAFNDEHIRSVLESRWGVIQETPEARRIAIEKWQKTITPDSLAKTSLENGAELFRKNCASCHKLYGEGKTIGPDLTGANRSSVEYLLINILDPHAVVPKQFTTSVLVLQDGRIVTGVVVSETEQTLVVQTDREQITLAVSEVSERRNTGQSLMPDGLLDKLTEQEVLDLFGFIMFRK